MAAVQFARETGPVPPITRIMSTVDSVIGRGRLESIHFIAQWVGRTQLRWAIMAAAGRPHRASSADVSLHPRLPRLSEPWLEASVSCSNLNSFET